MSECGGECDELRVAPEELVPGTEQPEDDPEAARWQVACLSSDADRLRRWIAGASALLFYLDEFVHDVGKLHRNAEEQIIRRTGKYSYGDRNNENVTYLEDEARRKMGRALDDVIPPPDGPLAGPNEVFP